MPLGLGVVCSVEVLNGSAEFEIPAGFSHLWEVVQVRKHVQYNGCPSSVSGLFRVSAAPLLITTHQFHYQAVSVRVSIGMIVLTIGVSTQVRNELQDGTVGLEEDLLNEK